MKISSGEMISFQAEIMGDRERAKKCRRCDHGLAYGPSIADENCHECAIELKKNRDEKAA
jgi:hypothetical protein